MIVYWAPGEGLGHLTRAAAVIHTIEPAGPIAIYGSAPASPQWLPLAPGAAYHALPEQPDAWRAIAESLATDNGDIWLDTFPAGLHGEWTGLDACYTLVARRLAWGRYLQRVHTTPPRPHHCLRLEPLETGQMQWLGDGCVEDLPLIDPPVPEVPRLLPDSAANWLILHSGPAAEVAQLAAHARQLATLAGVSPVFWLATESDISDPGLRAFAQRPVWPCLAQFDHVVCAAGFNTVRQVVAAGVPHTFLPLERSLDDQFFRARWARMARDPACDLRARCSPAWPVGSSSRAWPIRK